MLRNSGASTSAIDIGSRNGRRVLDDHDLMLEFQSLGENVELGMVQRACGAEPLNLFRFTVCRIQSLCEVLETRLEHLFTGDDLEVFLDYKDGRFHCRSRRYQDFTFYAFATIHTTLEEITIRERKKTAFLRRRLLEDLAETGKIFVRKGSDAIGNVRRLHRALRAYGSHDLLFVNVSDIDHPAGSIERVDRGLLRGFVSRFSVCGRCEPFDVATWLVLCRAAHEMTRSNASFVLPRKLQAASSWTFADDSEVREGTKDGPATEGGRQAVFAIAKRKSDEPIEVIATAEVSVADLEAGATIVFSAWVRPTEAFSGRRLFVSFEGVPTKHANCFDLRFKDRWQRIWSTTRVPRETRRLTAHICVENSSGEPLLLGGWTLESGSAPSDLPRGAGERFAAWSIRVRRSAMLRRARHARRVLDATPASLCQEAERLIAEGAFVEADDLLSTAMAAFPADGALAKMYALSTHNSGRYTTAIDRWNHALSLNTDDPMCFAGFASNLREHWALDRAKDVIGSALARFPESMVVLTEAARIADVTHRPADALCLWEKAIALHGANPQWLAAREHARRALPHHRPRLDDRAGPVQDQVAAPIDRPPPVLRAPRTAGSS